MKLVLVLLIGFSVSKLFAQANSETNAPPITGSSESSFWDKLRNVPLGMAVTNEIVADTQTTSLTGITNATDVVLSYKITSKNSIKLTSGMTVADTNSTNTETAYNGTALIFSRTGLLSQDKHGVDMYANIRYKALPGGTNVPGYGSVRVGVSRNFGPKFSLLTESRWEQYVRNASSSNLTRSKLTFILGPSYMLTEKFSVSPTVVFSESLRGIDSADTNYVNFAPSLDYTFTPKFSGSLYWDTYPFKSGDQSFIAPRWYSKGSIGLYLSYNVF